MVTMSMSLWAISAQEVAKKGYEAMSGYGSSISKTTMMLQNQQGDKNIRKLEISKLEGEDGDRSLITFLYPADIKETKLLSHEQIGKDDKQWLYLPALKRIKRISSRNKSGSFMASEFSYEDIASQNYKNFSYSGEAKSLQKDGKTYFEILRTPKDANSGYSKQIVYCDTTTFLPHFARYFDKQERLLKEVSFLEYRQIEGIWRIAKITIFNVQNKKSSTLLFEEEKLHQNLSLANFHKRVLR